MAELSSNIEYDPPSLVSLNDSAVPIDYLRPFAVIRVALLTTNHALTNHPSSRAFYFEVNLIKVICLKGRNETGSYLHVPLLFVKTFGQLEAEL